MRPFMLMCLLLSSIACSVTPTPNQTSGVEGQVLLGPSCPVVRPNDPNCADRPYQATLTILTTSGQEVARFSTDAEGKFHVSLAPGDYVLHPENANGPRWPHAQEQPFTVAAGRYTQITVTYDSGIR